MCRAFAPKKQLIQLVVATMMSYVLLSEHLPGVDESAVVGVPHPDFGESIVAVITALPGKKPPGEAEILKVLAKRLAKFKLP